MPDSNLAEMPPGLKIVVNALSPDFLALGPQDGVLVQVQMVEGEPYPMVPSRRQLVISSICEHDVFTVLAGNIGGRSVTVAHRYDAVKGEKYAVDLVRDGKDWFLAE
jgi:hypothetical protein